MKRQNPKSSSKKRQNSKNSSIFELIKLLKEFLKVQSKKLAKFSKITKKSKKSKNRNKRQSLAPRLFQEYLKLDISSIVIGLLLILLIIIFGLHISRKNHTENLHKEYSNLVETAQRAALLNKVNEFHEYQNSAKLYQDPAKTGRVFGTENNFSLQDLNKPRDLPPGVKAPTDFSGAVKMVQKALAEGKRLEDVMAG